MLELLTPIVIVFALGWLMAALMGGPWERGDDFDQAGAYRERQFERDLISATIPKNCQHSEQTASTLESNQ